MTLASYILACAFWLLAALGIVTLMAFVYVEVQYYHWNKEEREHDRLVEELSKHIAEKIEETRENSDETENIS